MLLTTGYAPEQELLDDTLSILRKPYRLGSLSEELRLSAAPRGNSGNPKGSIGAVAPFA